MTLVLPLIFCPGIVRLANGVKGDVSLLYKSIENSLSLAGIGVSNDVLRAILTCVADTHSSPPPSTGTPCELMIDWTMAGTMTLKLKYLISS